MDRLDVTVVIVTFQRANALAYCIESIIRAAKECRSIKIKILLGINGPDPVSSAITEKLKDKYEKSLIEFENFAQPLTPAECRNKLLRKTGSRWVFFLDDDAYLPEDYFNLSLDAIKRFPEASAIGGPNLTPPFSNSVQMASGIVLASAFATHRSCARYRKLGISRSTDERELILCNLWVKTDVLLKNIFPNNFICAEENWVMESMRIQGFELIYEPNLHVYHDRRASVKEFTKQISKYGFGRAQNICRRPQIQHWIYFVPTLSMLALLASILLWAITRRHEVYFFAMLGIYILFCIGAWIGTKSRAFLTFSLFPLVHFSYALGFARGLRFELKSRYHK